MVTEIQLIFIKWLMLVAFTIIVIILLFTYIPILLDNLVYGQTATPTTTKNTTTPTPIKPPTIVPSPSVPTTTTPNVQVSPSATISTTPTPNLQYLPQKAFIQAFNPEVAPTTQSSILGPLPVSQTPTVVTSLPAVTAAPAADLGMGSIMGILGTVMAAGTAFYAKIKGNQVKEVKQTSQANASAIVDTKIVQQEIARYMFELDKAKADALTNAPAIKLENLSKQVKSATETATKA